MSDLERLGPIDRTPGIPGSDKKNGITKTLAYKIYFLWKTSLSLSARKGEALLTKLEKFKNALRGVVLPLPPDMLSLSSFLLLVIISFAKRNVVTDQASRVSLSLLLLPITKKNYWQSVHCAWACMPEIFLGNNWHLGRPQGPNKSVACMPAPENVRKFTLFHSLDIF